MFWDLNLKWTNANTARLMALQAAKLGYDGVAFNHITTKLSPNDVCSMDLPKIDPVDLHDTGVLRDASQGKKFRVKSRITVHIPDISQQHIVSVTNNVVMSYDLVAIVPGNDKVMHAIAQNDAVDIVTLDFSQRLPFFLKPMLVSVILDSGKAIEVSYSASLGDSQARKSFFSNMQLLLHVSRGKGVILSSEASRVIDMRSPHDVINVGVMCGLKQQAAKASISQLCERVIDLGLTRRTHKGAIYVGTSHSEQKTPASSLSALSVKPIESESHSWSAHVANNEVVEEKEIGSSKSETLTGSRSVPSEKYSSKAENSMQLHADESSMGVGGSEQNVLARGYDHPTALSDGRSVKKVKQSPSGTMNHKNMRLYEDNDDDDNGDDSFISVNSIKAKTPSLTGSSGSSTSQKDASSSTGIKKTKISHAMRLANKSNSKQNR